MALTPEDVVNKRFQPTKFREGYDQDEVDDFLDEVVVELRRLHQENEELKQRLVAGDSRIAELQSDEAPATSTPGVVSPAPVAAPVAAVPAPVVASAVAEEPTPAADDETESTNNLLQLARRLHEEHVREGKEKRDALIAEGHATAARVVAEAESQQREQISALDRERGTLEKRIDELRTFERDYRQSLKNYIEGQLSELNSTASSSADAGATGTGSLAQPSTPVAASATQGAGEAVQAPQYPGFGG